MSRRRGWSNEEDTTLLTMIRARKTQREIATLLERPKTSIGSRLVTLAAKGITPFGTHSPTALPRRAPPHAAAEATKGRRATDGGRPCERQVRRCLGCGNDFSSAHAGNRLCSRCRFTATSASPYAP